MTSDIFKRFKDKFIFTSANFLRNLQRDFTGDSDVGYLKLLTIIRHQHHCLNLDAVIMCLTSHYGTVLPDDLYNFSPNDSIGFGLQLKIW